MNKSALVFVIAGAAALAGLFIFFKPQTVPAPAAAAAPLVATIDSAPAQAGVAAPLPAPILEAASPKTFELVIKARKLVSGPQVLQVSQGDTVVITITCDEAEELHLHGYNKKVDIEPKQPASLKFIADRSGRFEYELEKSRTELGALEVQPK